MQWLPNKTAPIPANLEFSAEAAYQFHQSIRAYQPASLRQLSAGDLESDVSQIWVKDESSRFGLQAFKGLGASYAIHRYIQKYGHPKAFCTATDGNHGRAVAWAAQLHDVPAYIFMPRETVEHRVKAIQDLGAKVEVTNYHYDETVTYASRQAQELGWALIQDTAWEGYEEVPHWIMEGYLTQMVEVIEQLQMAGQDWPEIVVLQSGVGSWAASVIWYLKAYLDLDIKVVLVEPERAAGAMASASAGKRMAPQGDFQTVMAGLNCGIPSLLAWPIFAAGVDLFLAIEDKWAERAMALYKAAGIESGESGAAGLAGLLAILEDKNCREHLRLDNDAPVMLFNTEGKTNPLRG